MLIASEKIFDYFNVNSYFFLILIKFFSLPKRKLKPAMEKAWILRRIIMKRKIFLTSIPMFKEVYIIYSLSNKKYFK